ncbi:hypothetical protein J4Q44_G00187250 [Coregonus suidteri]|uniref:Transmembrane protein 53 n=1 Tax=Coregonus suidteri TaxID=861788 RepID=A0AAN8QP80_9TELE
MADDGMDYNVVFPDALISERHWHGTKEPVVILLGWAGCRDKHLAKYSSIYNEQGCVTICYTAPLKTVFVSESFGYKELSNTAHKLLEILYDYEVENSPIFFHVFSNGGFMLYRYIVEHLHSHKQVVLYPITKYIHKNHYDAIRECPPTWPQLYLYSRADRVIRYSDVELMVKTLKEKGVSVECFDFKTPAHVSHFRDFPEEYSKRCLDFLTNCMKDSTTQIKKRHLIQH